MVKELILNVEKELISLGYRSQSVHEIPDVINRVEITLRLAQLHYFNKHSLTNSDKKWCNYYSHYVHFFDSEKFHKLDEAYCQLIEQMEKDNCFNTNKAK